MSTWLHLYSRLKTQTLLKTKFPMINLRSPLMLVAGLVAFSCMAQKMKVEKGDLSVLKGQKTVNVEFVYDNLKLFKDDRSEAAYIEERKRELNEKGADKGETWEKKWIASRELIWEPKFMELINRTPGMKFKQGDSDAKYTLIVDAVWLYPGYNVGVMKQGSKLNTDLTIVQTDDKSKALVKISATDAPGDTYQGTFSNEDRIGESFAKTGKTLSKMISKKLK